MSKRLGKQTVRMQNGVGIAGYASIAGKKEGEGPLRRYFDILMEDAEWGEKTWEKTESKMQKSAVAHAVEKAGINLSDINYIFAGDLLNQCIGSSFGLRELEIPFLGVYGACSTMAETLGLAAMTVDGGFADCSAAVTSSHFCTAERQYRTPLEYGGQRPPTAQWTVTGAGSSVVSNEGRGTEIKAVQIGTITDLGITDANNMGAAMAPAAARTISSFLNDTGSSPEDYNLILTGDLGYTGSQLLYELLEKEHNIKLKGFHKDCGTLIFDLKKQDVNSGGSGCGCSASVLCSHILKQMDKGILKKVLFVATGALMSPTSSKQGNSIPGIAHAVLLER